ncbi:MAG: phosphoenolpyruvate synthase [Thermosulfidibacteraceae bacterium]|jgi:pyruvate,water dikinase
MKYVRWFDEITIEDLPLVGGKTSSLGEMYNQLSRKGINIPYGFAVTAYGYWRFIDHNLLREKIYEVLKDLDINKLDELALKGQKIRDFIYYGSMPEDLEEEIKVAYKRLCELYGENTDVAVRSSATAEDLPDASFAGQQDTYLNIRGIERVIDAVKKCFSSLFTDRAIYYRTVKGFDHFNIALSIAIQKMVRSDLASSGVMFTIDTETGFKDVILITAAYGLGEVLVQGEVNPDEYYVFKETLKKGYRPIIRKRLGQKQLKMVYSDKVGTSTVKKIPVPVDERRRFALRDEEILKLANWGLIIEEHYSNKAGTYRPMDIEWAKDGITGELFVVQARPETVHSQKEENEIEIYKLLKRGKIIAIGRSVGNKIAAGKARVITDVKNIKTFEKGEILVTEMTDPDWEPIMKMAKAIVTERGGRTCHAAIVARELGVPAVVGAQDVLEKIKTGMEITVSCAEGEDGFIYEGILPFEVEKIKIQELPQTRTKVMMILGNPEEAFKNAMIPNDGVGLARLEFIINSYIQIHPMALVRFDKITDKETKEKIEELTYGYSDKREYFTDKLAEGIATIAAAFYPKPVIVRMSDFKTNEYANLIGGRYFEPPEHNPMLGWRGASRYYHPNYREGFALECLAVKKVRKEMGLTNVKVMIPFCRTPEEGLKVIEEMAKNGLKQGENGLEVYVMCELPVNVILADKFAQIFDGFSIGSNDLTQLVLGVDRDSELIAHLYDERNEAVKRMIAMVIETAHKFNRVIGICGQGPSDYPDFAEFLVECGIDSISLTPDTVLTGKLAILKAEEKLLKK